MERRTLHQRRADYLATANASAGWPRCRRQAHRRTTRSVSSTTSELGTIDVFGLNLAASRKYRNVAVNGRLPRSWSTTSCRSILGRCAASRSGGGRGSRRRRATDIAAEPQVIRIHPRRDHQLEPRPGAGRDGGAERHRRPQRSLMETSLSVLDDALERVSALEFAPPIRFVSHAPMACEALSALGFDDVIEHWVERFEALVGGGACAAVPPVWHGDFDWQALVGDSRLLPAVVGLFRCRHRRRGMARGRRARGCLGSCRGWHGALFHGVIRTSHAVRAIDRSDTPARRAELARALANWATWFRPGDDDGGDRPLGPIRTQAALRCRSHSAPAATWPTRPSSTSTASPAPWP